MISRQAEFAASASIKAITVAQKNGMFRIAATASIAR
jgi:hypothetical protein